MMLLESVSTMDFIGTKLVDFLTYTGFANVTAGNLIMIAVGAFFIWLAIKKDFEPLLLVPIGLGIILGNIPFRAEHLLPRCPPRLVSTAYLPGNRCNDRLLGTIGKS